MYCRIYWHGLLKIVKNCIKFHHAFRFWFRVLHSGDHIAVKTTRLGEDFYHHGIFISNYDGVIDFGAGQNGEVRRVSVKAFADGEKILRVIYNHGECFPPEKVVKNARRYLENPESCGKYDIVNNNCEHFASKCKTGTARSDQLFWKVCSCFFNPIRLIKLVIAGPILSVSSVLSTSGGSCGSSGSCNSSCRSGSSNSCRSNSLNSTCGSNTKTTKHDWSG